MHTCMLRHCRCTLLRAHVPMCGLMTVLPPTSIITLFLTHVASSLCLAPYRLDSLERNRVGDEGAVALAKVLKHNTTLEILM